MLPQQQPEAWVPMMPAPAAMPPAAYQPRPSGPTFHRDQVCDKSFHTVLRLLILINFIALKAVFHMHPCVGASGLCAGYASRIHKIAPFSLAHQASQ